STPSGAIGCLPAARFRSQLRRDGRGARYTGRHAQESHEQCRQHPSRRAQAMDCSLTQDNLFAYHFATLNDEQREAVEAHLLGCTACLRTYLALKAHMDRAGAQEQPSEQVRLKLRNAVEHRFAPTRARRLRRWFTRPIPRYQSLALAAVVMIFVMFVP